MQEDKPAPEWRHSFWWQIVTGVVVGTVVAAIVKQK